MMIPSRKRVTIGNVLCGIVPAIGESVGALVASGCASKIPTMRRGAAIERSNKEKNGHEKSART